MPSHLRKCLKEKGFSSLRGTSCGGVLLAGGGSEGEVDCAASTVLVAGSLSAADEQEDGDWTALTDDDGVAPVRSSVLILLLSFAIARGYNSCGANAGGPLVATFSLASRRSCVCAVLRLRFLAQLDWQAGQELMCCSCTGHSIPIRSTITSSGGVWFVMRTVHEAR